MIFVRSVSHYLLVALFCFNQACEAGDSQSEASQSRAIETALQDQMPPEWPAQAVLTRQSISESIVSISWPKARDDVGVALYRIYLDHFEVGDTLADLTEATIDGLRPSTRYTIRVEAEDASGNRSDTGPELMVHTPDETSPIWPHDAEVYASSITASGCLITWEWAQDNVEVIEYIVKSDDLELARIVAPDTVFQIDQLQPDTAYVFTVYALDTAHNMSAPLSIEIRTLDENAPIWPDPSQLMVSTITENDLTLTWTPAEDDGELSGYRLFQDHLLIGETTENVLSFQVEGLEPFHEYTFRLEAVDRFGNQSDSGPTNTIQTLDQSAPIWPSGTSLRVTYISSNQVRILWDPATDYVAVVGYRIERDGVEVGALEGVETSGVFSALEPGRTYTFSVYARDPSSNWSLPLTLVVSTPDERRPIWSSEARLTVSDVTPHELHIQWPPVDSETPVARYLVYRDHLEIAQVSEAEIIGPMIEYRLEGLDVWTEYHLRVEAELTSGHRSIGGPQLTIRTGDDSPPILNAEDPLSALGVESTRCVLRWGPARDDGVLTSYHLSRNGEEVLVTEASTTQAVIEDLAPGRSYTMTLTALDAAGHRSADQTIVLETPDFTAPFWPENSTLFASDPQSTAVTLTWTQAQDDVSVVGYRLYHQNIERAHYEAETLSARVDELSYDDVHTFRIEAIDASGHLSVDGPQLVVSLADTTPPTWPESSALEAHDLTPISIRIGWTAAADDVTIAGYRIESSDEVLAVTSGTRTETVIEGLTPSTSYTFKVIAYDGVGQSTEGPTLMVISPDYAPPTWSEPATLEVSELEPDRLLLTWGEALGAVVSYRVFQDTILISELDADTLNLTISNLTPETAYAYEIYAVGPTGRISDELFIDVETPPDQPPIWPVDAELETSDIRETAVTLTWMRLPPSQRVSHYRVFVDEAQVIELEGDVSSFRLRTLLFGVEVTVRVEAVNTRGLVSDTGPELTLTPRDVSPPTWPLIAEITLESLSVAQVVLNWTAASDNIEVTGYRVYRDALMIVELDGDSLSHRVLHLAPNTQYIFTVEAIDAQGLESSDGPQVTVMTLSGVGIPTDQEVHDALVIHCQACHSDRQWFGAIEDFRNNLINGASMRVDRPYIVMGDPDRSLLVEFLEENGPVQYESTQMPPDYFYDSQASYLDLSNAGETAVTSAQIRDWISIMGSDE